MLRNKPAVAYNRMSKGQVRLELHGTLLVQPMVSLFSIILATENLPTIPNGISLFQGSPACRPKANDANIVRIIHTTCLSSPVKGDLNGASSILQLNLNPLM